MTARTEYMDLLVTAGRTLGFSLAAGVNLYATVAILGLAARYGLVDCRRSSRPSTTPGSSAWRWCSTPSSSWPTRCRGSTRCGTPCTRSCARSAARWLRCRRWARPRRGCRASIALVGGTLAAGGHFTKAGTRAAVNVSPEPFTNWGLSLAEDVFVIGLGVLALEVSAGGAGRHGGVRARSSCSWPAS